MGVGEVCTRDTVVVAPRENVLTAALLMLEHGVGSVVVAERGRPVGILTDRDIAIRIVAGGRSAQETQVQDIMSPELTTILQHHGVGDAIRLMRSARVRRLPVVEKDGALVGIVSLDDLLDLLAEEMEALVSLIRSQ